jgi:hypothetical protein
MGDILVLTAGTLTDEYAGWYLKVATNDPVFRWRHLELKRVRSHELHAGTKTALVAKDPEGVYAGIEYHVDNDAGVVLDRPITAKAKRMAKEMGR